MSETAKAQPSGIPGYTFGTPALRRAAIRLAELEPVQSTMLFTDEDARRLRVLRQVVAPHIAAPRRAPRRLVRVRRIASAPASSLRAHLGR